MIDDVRLTFAALRQGKPAAAGDLTVLPISGHGGVYLALDDAGRPHLLLETTDEVVPHSGVATLELMSRALVVAGRPTTFLDIACVFAAITEVFDYFVAAVVDRISGAEAAPAQAVAEVLDQWRQFLTPGAGAPGRDRLAAVFGELLIVLDIASLRCDTAVSAWAGPHGGRHDFRCGATAIEVKTTLAHTSRVVTIHGEDQLLEPEEGDLFLHLVRLENVAEGSQSVSSLVDEIMAAGVPARDLFEALASVGIAAPDLVATRDVRFDVRERITFPVDADTPRIVPDSFVTGARPVGVIDLSYRIDLDHVLGRAIDGTSYAALITRLSGDGSAA